MTLVSFVLLGFVIAALGSIAPSFLNLTVVKFSLKSGRKSALYLIGGYATVLFFQANLGAYLAKILMENSEYITTIQKIGTAILILLSIHFFRLHYTSKQEKKKKKRKVLKGLAGEMYWSMMIWQRERRFGGRGWLN